MTRNDLNYGQTDSGAKMGHWPQNGSRDLDISNIKCLECPKSQNSPHAQNSPHVQSDPFGPNWAIRHKTTLTNFDPNLTPSCL